MRRLARSVVTALRILSVAAAVAAAGLWVRSHRVAETWHFAPTPAPPADAAPLPGKPEGWLYQYHLACARGRVQLVRRNLNESAADPPGRRAVPHGEALTDLAPGGNAGGRGWRAAGFEYFRSDRRYVSAGNMRAWVWGFPVVGVPLWAPALAFTLPPAWAVLRWRITRRRGRLGLCRGCGYDLRASRTFGRCPECGWPAGAAADAGGPGKAAAG